MNLAFILALFVSASEGDHTGDFPGAPILASTVVRDYRANELRAEGRYKGKTTPLLGVVESVGRDAAGRAFVALEGGRLMVRPFVCFLDPESIDRARELSKGQLVLLGANIQDLALMTVVADHCSVRWGGSTTKVTQRENNQGVLSFLACIPSLAGNAESRHLLEQATEALRANHLPDGGAIPSEMKAKVAKESIFSGMVTAPAEAARRGIDLLPCTNSLVSAMMACDLVVGTDFGPKAVECDRPDVPARKWPLER